MELTRVFKALEDALAIKDFDIDRLSRENKILKKRIEELEEFLEKLQKEVEV